MEDLIEMFCDACGTVTVHKDHYDGITCTACEANDEEEMESIEEMRDTELMDQNGVEGVYNWEEWN